MSEAILVAFITGSFALLGTVITVLAANHKTNENLRISQAVTDTKIEELTREVRAHNNFAQRMPIVEVQIDELTKRVAALEKR